MLCPQSTTMRSDYLVSISNSHAIPKPHNKIMKKLTDAELEQLANIDIPSVYSNLSKDLVDRNESRDYLVGVATGLLTATKITQLPQGAQIAILAVIHECALAIKEKK